MCLPILRLNIILPQKNPCQPVFFLADYTHADDRKYQNTQKIDRAYAEEGDRSGAQNVRRRNDLHRPGRLAVFFYPKGEDRQSTLAFISPIDALQALDVPAAFNGRNDLVIRGKKFPGNAQVQNPGHDGASRFASVHTDMRKCCAVRRSTRTDPVKSIKSVRDRVTNIADHLPTPMTPTPLKHMVSYILGITRANRTGCYRSTAHKGLRRSGFAAGRRATSRPVSAGKHRPFCQRHVSCAAGSQAQHYYRRSHYRRLFGNEEAERINRRIIGQNWKKRICAGI